MPIDVLNDELIPLSQIARNLPKKPSPPTLWRWHKKGVNGFKLEVVRIGGRVFTSSEAWSEFIRNTTDAGNASSKMNEDSSIRPEKTRRDLEKDGLLPSQSTQP